MKHITSVLSKDETTSLHCVTWLPETDSPVAIVQLVHGMAEYVERYEEFAHFLNKQGCIVVGHDHLGHGESVNKEDPTYGYFSDEESSHLLIEDTYHLTQITKTNYPHLPYFILGHSMGSFVVRCYLKKYSHEVTGAILMGTGANRHELKIALPILHTLNRISPRQVNSLVDTIAFGSFAQFFPEKRTKFDWLSANKQNVDNYINHPKTGFTFTNNGFYTLFSVMEYATRNKWFTGIRSTLPLLLISGEKDPVGNFGKGPREIATTLANSGFDDVTLHLYAGMRHEILQETQKLLVMNDIWQWLCKKIA